MDSAIVVGAGTFGASLAWLLARAGVAVTLIDQFEPGDAARDVAAASRGCTAAAHGGAADYTAIGPPRAATLWRELEDGDRRPTCCVERGAALVRAPRGRLGGARPSARCGRRTSRSSGSTSGEAAKRFPSFAGDDLAFVLHEPEAGAIRAAAGGPALVAAARAEGARVKRGRATPHGRYVELENGSRLEAGAVIWACGGWLRDLFPGLVDAARHPPGAVLPRRRPGLGADVPCWVDYDLAAYGTGDVDGLGVKIAPDAEGPPLEPDADAAGRRAAEGEADGARVRPPALPGARRRAAEAVQVAAATSSRRTRTSSPREHPAEPGVWIVGGGSGHGFKHGPALAERVVAALRGERAAARRASACTHRAPGALAAHRRLGA